MARKEERELRYYPTPEAREPRPEPDEPRLEEPIGLRDLSTDDWKAMLVRAGKKSMDDQITDIGATLAYYSFLAIPSALLVFFGLLGLFAPESVLQTVATTLANIGPGATQDQFLGGAIQRLNSSPSQTIPMAVVGFVLAFWTLSGAVSAFMRGLNRAYDRDETRGFVEQRVVALKIIGLMLGAFLIVGVFMILGPQIAQWLGDTIGIGGWIQTIWWVAQWPIVLVGLSAAFAAMLYIGPNAELPRWKWLTPGAVVATVVWVVASGLFAIYTSMFGSYNQTWGSLSAVIITLMWLWITGMALIFGGEVNVEAERSRELRKGEPAERELMLPPKKGEDDD